MTILSAALGHGPFTVMDEAAGRVIREVLWVDDVLLQVAVMSNPTRIDAYGSIDPDLIAVSNMRIDYAGRIVHVNEPSVPAGAAGVDLPAKPCDACTQPEACRRTHYCPAYRCGFGEVAKP